MKNIKITIENGNVSDSLQKEIIKLDNMLIKNKTNDLL